MHSLKMDFDGSRDLISGLPESLVGHILSFLPTKEAASTSVLSKIWKNLLAFVPNLDFDDSIYLHPRVGKRNSKKNSESFMDFVDSVLALQANARLKKFHLKCKDFVDPARLLVWIPKVLERGVLDLDVYISSSWEDDYDWIPGYLHLPSEIFASKTLVRLKIRVKDGVSIDVEDDISLPKLKTLHLDHVWIENIMFDKLLSGCPALEDLVLDNLLWDTWEPFSVSSTTVKRLRICRTDKKFHLNSHYVSFDLPNLVYLEYSDLVAFEYPKVRFDSLVEARLDLRLTDHQIAMIRLEYVDPEMEGEMVISEVTNLLMGIRNVKILYLSDDTLEVLKYCCETMPIFYNLTHLTIHTYTEVGWILSALLTNSPNLETLIVEGLTNTYEDEEMEDVFSPVKVFKVLKFGENCDDMEEQINQVKHFLETMPYLENIIVTCYTPTKEDVIKISNQLQMLPKIASSKCEIRVISDHLL